MPFIGNLELVAPGLTIHEALQWLAATRDWHIGKYGCIEVKSYKRFEKFTKWLCQLLVQLYVYNSVSGPRRRYVLLMQLRFGEAQKPFEQLCVADVLRKWRMGLLQMRLHIVTMDETPESKAERVAFIASLQLPKELMPEVTHFTRAVFEAEELPKIIEAYAHIVEKMKAEVVACGYDTPAWYARVAVQPGGLRTALGRGLAAFAVAAAADEED